VFCAASFAAEYVRLKAPTGEACTTMGKIRALGKELLRRKVVRLVGAYVAVFWLLAVGLSSLLPALGAPPWVMRWFMIVGIAAIPALAFFSWRYDIVPPHLVRDTGHAPGPNPALAWARVRHDTTDAGYVLLSWVSAAAGTIEKRFFQPVAIGRDPGNDIELADERVSRHHAVIWAEKGVWRVRDLESANGTFIGYTRVTGTANLPDSCELRLHPNGPAIGVAISRSSKTIVG
jgi:hypothetical protein